MMKSKTIDICKCGHTGEAHADTVQKGHGECLIKGCECWKFTWVAFASFTE